MIALYLIVGLLALRLLCAALAAACGASNAFDWKRTFRRSPSDPPYMIRRQLLRSPWIDIYLNCILTLDYDPEPHNHPWKRCYSLKLFGSYIERIYSGPGLIFEHWRVPKRWSKVPTIHRIEDLIGGKPAWTLFIGIGRSRVWGFFEMPGGRFVRHDERGAATQRSNVEVHS